MDGRARQLMAVVAVARRASLRREALGRAFPFPVG